MPITGYIWGLVLKYNCTPVNRLGQFTILNRRVNSSNPAYVSHAAYSGSDTEYFYTLDDGSSISVLSELGSAGGGPAPNIIGFAEVGLSTGFADLLESSATWGYSATGQNFSIPTYSGLDEEEIFEMALWQTYLNPPGTTGNFVGVQNPIPELENEHTQPDNPWGGAAPWDGDMEAIGIRCTSSSTTGTAKVNGFTGTFSEFEREDPYTDGGVPPNPPRLDLGIPLMLLQTNQSQNFLNYGMLDTQKFERLGNYSVNYTLVNTNYEWLGPLIVASGLALNLSDTAQQLDYYYSLVQTPELQRAITFAYQQYAVQLMYQRASDISDAWTNNNITAAIPWSFIRAANPGVPPVFILVTMLLWAFGCASLGILYGFQRRWSDTFDDDFVSDFIKDQSNKGLHLESLDFLAEEGDKAHGQTAGGLKVTP